MNNALNVKISAIRKKHSWIIDGFIQGETYAEFINYCKERNIKFDKKLKDRLLDAITPCEECIKLTKAKKSKPYTKEIDRNQWRYSIEQSIDKLDNSTTSNIDNFNPNDHIDFAGEMFDSDYSNW